ncbi:MAG TPA: hypothetical protein ENF61_02715 [Firmicutes bacterium]|nr:hypothetical protein [Bacillota bacterium]
MEDKRKLKQGFQISIGVLVFQIFLSSIFYIMYTKTKSPLLLSETFHIGIGIPISGILFLLYHQRYRERLEIEELEELKKREGKIFKEEESLILVSRVRLKQIEKWLIPAITFIITFFLIYTPLKLIAYFRGKKIPYHPSSVIPLLLIGLTFPIFILSRYILGMSKDKRWKDLQSLGSFLGVNAIFSFLTAISLTLKNLNLPKVEWFIFYFLNFFLILIGIEYFLNIIASFYISGKEKRYPFDSKILYLLALPEEVIPSFSEIIEYQFGFRITQTWFYQFIKKRIIPLLLLQITLLYLLSCIVIVRPYERCFIEFLGKPIGNGKIFGPGLHLKFPWPISKAKIYDVERIKTIRIGAKGEEGERLLWTERHFKEEFKWIIASKEIASPGYTTVPVNFLSGVVWVYYKIDPDRLFEYAYLHSEPDKVLESIVRSKFTRLMMGVDFHEILTVKRLEVVDILKEILQKEADKHHLGIKILLINLGNVHPPVEVARSFEKVVGAMERKEASILDAEAYRNKELTLANYKASQTQVKAEAYRFVRAVESKGQREAFLKALIAYRKNPVIFKYRHYLKVLEKSLSYPTKYIVISSRNRERNVTIINLEKTPLPEILPLEGETKEKK